MNATAIDPGWSAATPDQESALSQALAWIQNKWGAFVALDTKIEDLQHQAAEIAYSAQLNGDTATSDLMKTTIGQLGDLRSTYDHAVALFDSIKDQVPSFQGLGQFPGIPYALMGTLIILGGYVAYVVTRETALEKIVDGARNGTMTPELAKAALAAAARAAASAPDKLGEFVTAAKWIIGGVLAIMVLKTVRELV